METTVLGRTGLRVTIAGLGCGGFSRIGIDKGIDHAAGIVRAAYDEGVTFFDTAAIYTTQPAVGKGLRGVPRDSYVISTKFTYADRDGNITAENMAASLERSLSELETDYVDVYHIHGLMPQDYERARDTLIPALQRAKSDGKIRFIGVTERFGEDTEHKMLEPALKDDLYDVIMVGHNILNPSATERVLPVSLKNNLGVLCMFAVRKALWNNDQLAIDIARILEAGQGGEGLDANSLDFLTKDGIATTLPEAAYRYVRHTPGITVTLTGTSNPAHLKDNLRSLALPPLPDQALARLQALFGNVDCVSGQ